MQHKAQKFGRSLAVCTAGLFLAIGATGTARAGQSNNTGTNIWDNPAPFVETLEGLDEETRDRARRLSEDIETARAACEASLEAAAGRPRRFSLGSGDRNQNCSTPECDRLEALANEAQQFLSQVERQREEQRLRSDGSDSPW